MKTTAALITTASLLLTSQARAELLLMDNFDADDTTNFDLASTAGRLTGTLANDVFLLQANTEQTIVSNQLVMRRAGDFGSGRMRFHDLDGWYDWASSLSGPDILVAGGLRVAFDWTSPDITTDDWVSFNIGHADESAGEPGTRVNNAETDYGVLLRGRGAAQSFQNGAVLFGDGNTDPDNAHFTATTDPQHVVIDLAFDSFADGANVDVLVTLDGVTIDDRSFTWNNNNGELYMELGSFVDGMIIDNYAVSTLTAAPLTGDTDGDGDIDDFDLLNAISNFTGSLAAGTGGRGIPEGDTDADADVDDFDLLNMISGFTGSLSAPAVPEPGSAALLGLGGIGMLRRRRNG